MSASIDTSYNTNPKSIKAVKGEGCHYTEGIIDRKYTGICLGISGIKGLIQIGAINELWMRQQLTNLKYFSGVSAGSILCFMLIIGYSPMDILAGICSPNFTEQFNSVNFMNIKTLSGLYPNSIIRKKIEEMTMLKIGFLPTFKELYNLTGKFLTVAQFCLSERDRTKRKIFHNHITTPNIKVTDSVILSSTIPIVFQKAIFQDKIYIDGGYNTKFPLTELQTFVPKDEYIIGIMLGYHKEMNPDSLFDYIHELMYIPIYDESNYGELNQNTDIVDIIDSSVSSTDFNQTIKSKIEMFSRGTKFMKDIINEFSQSTTTNVRKNKQD